MIIKYRMRLDFTMDYIFEFDDGEVAVINAASEDEAIKILLRIKERNYGKN